MKPGLYHALMVMLMLACGAADAAEFYVAPSGNDANPGTKARPFASPQRAQEAVRAAKRQGDGQPITVVLRGGLYPLRQTLTFTPEDSGTETNPVVWRSAPGERATLSGGRILSGFRESTVGGTRRWTLELPEVRAGGPAFRQLFVSTAGGPDQRRYRPHIGMKRVDGLTYSPKRPGAAAHRAAQIDFLFAPGDFRQWENLSDVEVVVLHVWSSSRLLVRKVDTERNLVTFTGMPTFAVNQGGLQPYYIENVKEALAAPGEWYLDRPTGFLTYLPCKGETLANTRIVVPQLANVVALTGDYPHGRFVSNLVFDHLSVAHNEWPLPREGYGGSQGQADLPAAVELTGARGCTFRRCMVAHTGTYGIGIGLGSSGNAVVGCRLYDLGAGGVKVGDLRMDPQATAPELPTDNCVENCAISDGGVLFFSANAIWGGIVRGTAIRHNRIWGFPYSGIALGWSWNEKPTAAAGNRIEYNDIGHVLELIADGGSIYTLGRQPGNVIRGNVIHDNVKSPFAKEYWQLGLYLDEGSSEMLVENNLVHHVGTHGFNMNGGAKNVIRNNILGPVYNGESARAPYIRSAAQHAALGNVFTRNICYCDSVNLADAPWARSLFECRGNLYWNFAGRPLQFAGKSFAEWQAGGQDDGSLNANPLFEDPEHGNYRLKRSSPAFSLGFQEFDITAAGLEPEFRDVAAPVKSTRPPVYAMRLPGPRPFTGFALDLEDVPAGMTPRGFMANGFSAQANFQVADGAGVGGGRALVATDSKGAAKPFYPYLTCGLPEPLTKGTVTFSCDVLQKADAPVTLDIGFRDYSRQGNAGKEFVAGPSVLFGADGRVRCGGAVLCEAPHGKWMHLGIAFPLAGPAREARITVALADGTTKEVRAPLDPQFTAVSSLGLICGEAVDGTCYLDNLKMSIKP